MGLMVYSTLAREKTPFTTVQPGKVGMYLCGPTVYKPSHVGHAVGPIIFDAIKRFLVFRGYDVTWVVNITDVDDKLIIEAANQNTTTGELAQRITDLYLEAMRKLHIDGVDVMPKASEHMPEIIGIIQTLIDKGYAYPSSGDVYFDVTKDSDYGKLSNRRIEDQESQRELVSGDKRNPADFALWKAAKPDEPKEVKFDSPWGAGRPGWHIECSAMAMRYLGDTLDIHGGGMDLLFPHHENELAQSESATGQPFTKFWMHHGLTRVNTKKISKSDADPEMQAVLQKMTLHNLLEQYAPELIRYFILCTHYRSPIEYSDAEIASKKKGLETFYRLFERIERICGGSPYADAPVPPPAIDEASKEPAPTGGGDRVELHDPELASACLQQQVAFERAMDDDFNTGVAIAVLFEFAGVINRFIEKHNLESIGSDDHKNDALGATRWLIGVARLLGVFLDTPDKASAGGDEVADRIMSVLIEVRHHLRKKKDFETADLIRDRLKDNSITLEDRAGETSWRAD